MVNEKVLGELGYVEAVGDEDKIFGLGLKGRVGQLKLFQHDKFKELLRKNGRIDILSNSDGNDGSSLLEELLCLTDSQLLKRCDFRKVKRGNRLCVERISFFLEFAVGKDLILNAPLLAEELGDVIPDAVGEDQHNSLGFVVLPSLFLDKFHSCLDHSAG